MNMKNKIWITLTALMLIIAITVSIIVIKSFERKQPAQVLREAVLYGFTVDGASVYRDTEGRQWEIKGTEVERILLQVDLGKKYRDASDDTVKKVWIEVNIVAGN